MELTQELELRQEQARALYATTPAARKEKAMQRTFKGIMPRWQRRDLALIGMRRREARP